MRNGRRGEGGGGRRNVRGREMERREAGARFVPHILDIHSQLGAARGSQRRHRHDLKNSAEHATDTSSSLKLHNSCKTLTHQSHKTDHNKTPQGLHETP